MPALIDIGEKTQRATQYSLQIMYDLHFDFFFLGRQHPLCFANFDVKSNGEQHKVDDKFHPTVEGYRAKL